MITLLVWSIISVAVVLAVVLVILIFKNRSFKKEDKLLKGIEDLFKEEEELFQKERKIKEGLGKLYSKAEEHMAEEHKAAEDIDKNAKDRRYKKKRYQDRYTEEERGDELSTSAPPGRLSGRKIDEEGSFSESKNIRGSGTENKGMGSDVGKFFTVIDELLGKLPEEEIQNFASSKEYEMYKKVMKRYLKDKKKR